MMKSGILNVCALCLISALFEHICGDGKYLRLIRLTITLRITLALVEILSGIL